MKQKCFSNLPHQVRNTVPLKFYIGRDTSRIRQATVGGDPVWRGERIGSLLLTFFDVCPGWAERVALGLTGLRQDFVECPSLPNPKAQDKDFSG